MGSVSLRRLFGNHPLGDFTDALCADPQVDPDFPYADETSKQAVMVKLCGHCPLGPNGDDTCLTKALDMEQGTDSRPYGVWGGVTAADRIDLMGWRYKSTEDIFADVVWGFDFEGED